MFKNLEIKYNNNFFLKMNFDNDSLIPKIEELLLKNQNILSIFKNDDQSYSIYDTKSISDDFIDTPLITFNINTNLNNVYSFIDSYITQYNEINNLNLRFKEEIKDNNKRYRNNIDNLDKIISEIKNMVFDKKETNKIYNIINKIIAENNFECADNFRYYKQGNKLQEYFYNNSLKNGCCGFYDKNIVLNNINYKIGFNYGH